MLFCALLHFTDPTEGQSPGSGVVRKPGVLSASHEISSITRLCPLPLQEVKNRFTLFYHQRVKRFFKNLYLEATSGKQLEKLPPLHDKKKKKINSGAEKEAQKDLMFSGKETLREHSLLTEVRNSGNASH